MKKIILLFIVTGILVGMVTACGSAADGTQKTHDTEISQQLTFDHSLDFAGIRMIMLLFCCSGREKRHRMIWILVLLDAAGTEYLSGGFGGYGYRCLCILLHSGDSAV